MAHAYTPGLTVTPRHRHRVRRSLPLEGEVLIEKGQRVNARDIAAQTFMPGDVYPLNLANALSVPPGDVPDLVIKKEGDRIEVGEVLARTKGIFGMLKSEYKSKAEGTIESISKITGQVIVRGAPEPVEVRAYLTGEVVEVLPGEGAIIEADVAFIQGIFGIGSEAYGPIRMAAERHDQELSPDLLQADMQGAIVIGGARMTADAIRRGIELGVAAIISGGIDDQDLRELLGYDLGVAITGNERIGTTLIITEGFGEIAMAQRTFQLLRHHAGHDAAVNGATQIRAGVMRPEIVIPLGADAGEALPDTDHETGQLNLGSPVRIIRDPYFGLIGNTSALPPEPQVLDSGSKARVLEVTLEDGKQVIVPRANVELIEEG